jgi:hypothetical protein
MIRVDPPGSLPYQRCRGRPGKRFGDEGSPVDGVWSGVGVGFPSALAGLAHRLVGQSGRFSQDSNCDIRDRPSSMPRRSPESQPNNPDGINLPRGIYG